MKYLKQVLHKRNFERAMAQVIRNKGSAGADGMKVDELPAFFDKHLGTISQAIESGKYQPQGIKGIEIPKPSGGKRLLGIPTVVDRVIQQAIHQVLSPVYEQEFAPYSYGFRPKKSARQAVHQALRHINEGYQDIIDLDLKSFFDVVNHDYLMSLLYKKIKDDERLLRLIRKYMKANMMLGGISSIRTAGTPQGSPLSPLLSNIILNELDKFLTAKSWRFIRYADDVSIFLQSKLETKRVLKQVTEFIEQKLHLKINFDKTQIVRPVNYCILGFNFISTYEKGQKGKYRLRVCPKSFKQLKRKIKEITRKTDPAPIREKIAKLKRLTVGWVNCFKDAYMQEKLATLDVWVRNRIRYCIWKHWKKPNRRMRAYRQMGIPVGQAYAWSRSRMGGWAVARSPMMRTTVTLNRLSKAGYISFNDTYQSVSPIFENRLIPDGT
jgi:group II intron reverse transcriptase/maturase